MRIAVHLREVANSCLTSSFKEDSSQGRKEEENGGRQNVCDRDTERGLTHRATYTGGGQNTQVDNILYRRKELLKVKDCYVLPKEVVAKQHKLVVLEKNLEEEEQMWSTLSSVVQETEEVLRYREVAKAKSRAYEDLHSSLEGQDGQRKAVRIAKQKNKEAQDVYQAERVKDGEGQVLTEDIQIREKWKEYYQQLMNVENPRVEWDIEAAEEREVEEVREEQVTMAVKWMKTGKAVGPDDIPLENGSKVANGNVQKDHRDETYAR
ncbi:uncharacterized protein LOC119575714 [Penaeus monodon]|uniref:uncharacterized protein LOC119575714 n=1 Tax=Penaeus monodon TaxID=6687 RepID=UPI0018A75879|nr:uncharacterized protein LOC119575714 [Penaeus monodon]